VINVPPLGRVVVDTHDAPLEIDARVTKIDFDKAGQMAGLADPVGQLETDARVDVAPLVIKLVVEGLVVAVLVGAVAGALLPRRRWRHVLLGALGGLVAVGSLHAWTWQQFKPAAFGAPRFEGALERAPAALDAVKREVGSLGGVRDRLAHLSGQIDELLRTAADPIGPTLDGDTRILHVSDIHLNPLGVEMARSLAERFDVAAIVDTGDLTSFGLTGEDHIGDLVDQIPVPYYFVPGNHDSPANRAGLDAHPNITLLDGQMIDIGGVRILGIADPRTTVAGGGTYDQAKAARRAEVPEVAADVERLHPDVLAVGGLDQAADVAGLVPLVISGDVHERTERVEGDTRFLTVGSTGATGLGSFTVDTGKRYEAELLRFRAGRLVAIDYVAMDGVTGAFTIDRTVYPTPDGTKG
jgi:predicted phosphodiesterase